MDMKRFFLYFMVIAALALAGCGGNGGTTTVKPPEPPPSCPDGQTGTPPNCVTPGPSVADLFEDVQNARDAAEDAETDAMDAVDDAVAASKKLGVLTVKGNSMTAEMNAQDVLDNKTKADDAVKTAQDALADLNQADKDADEHDNSALNNAIEDAIKVAEDAIDEAKKAAADSDLKDAVALVKGTDPKKPRSAVDIGQDVAMDIMDALKPDSTTNGAADNIAYVSPNATQAKTGMENIDRKGMTFKEIKGAANVKDLLIGAIVGSGTMKVEAVSVSNETVNFDQDGVADTSVSVDEGDQYSNDAGSTDVDISYMGIPGTIYCAGSDCKVGAAPQTGEARTLTGKWYFAPYSVAADDTLANDSMTSYIKASSSSLYTVEENHVEYGYWLEDDSADTNTTDIKVNVYAALGANASNYTTADDSFTLGAGTDKSATYKGDALGISLHKTFNSQGDVVKGSLKSAQFTADVELVAQFSANPSLRGKVTNFVGDAVDSTWEVDFLNTNFSSAGNITTASPGVAVSSGQNGVWSAQPYGGNISVDANATSRPLGIFGTFNAHFTNGNAAGAYATRKD